MLNAELASHHMAICTCTAYNERERNSFHRHTHMGFVPVFSLEVSQLNFNLNFNLRIELHHHFRKQDKKLMEYTFPL
jgi:hypothetical protein